MSKELDKKRCGANVEKVIIDEFVPSKAIDNSNPSEALESLERIDNTLCLNNIKGKLEFGIDTEEHIDCDSVIGMTEDLESIRQSLLKSQEQKEMIVELCEYFGLDDLYPYDDLEKIESALKNARDVSTQQRMELLGKLNKQEKEDAEYKRVLEILKPCLRLVNNFLQARIPLLDIDRWVIVKEITDEKEFDLLKRWFDGNISSNNIDN